jgi:hemolysin activation/secretion protein
VAASAAQAAAGTNAAPRFDVRAYVIKRDPLVFTNAPSVTLSKYTGTNVGLDRVAQAAKDLLLEYQKQGYPRANISIAQELITNGIVTLNVYQGVFPQVLISASLASVPVMAGRRQCSRRPHLPPPTARPPSRPTPRPTST